MSDPTPATEDLIQRLAREAGFDYDHDAGVLWARAKDGYSHYIGFRDLRVFAALVAEECAKVAEEWDATWYNPDTARAIRAKFKGPG